MRKSPLDINTADLDAKLEYRWCAYNINDFNPELDQDMSALFETLVKFRYHIISGYVPVKATFIKDLDPAWNIINGLITYKGLILCSRERDVNSDVDPKSDVTEALINIKSKLEDDLKAIIGNNLVSTSMQINGKITAEEEE